jgi:predicted DNA-binding ribbon-helix-helix protein
MLEFKSRVIIVNSRRTSVRLFDSEWFALEDLCKREQIPRKCLIEAIENANIRHLGLTGSIRLFSTLYYHSLADKSASANPYIGQIFESAKAASHTRRKKSMERNEA